MTATQSQWSGKTAGYFIQNQSVSGGDRNTDSDTDDNDSDGDGDEDFSLDLDSVDANRFMKKKGVIQVLRGNKKQETMRCRGRFFLQDPWWLLEFRCYGGGREGGQRIHWLLGWPIYSLRRDIYVQEENVVIIFLTSCLHRSEMTAEMIDTIIDAFLKFVELKKDHLTFQSLVNLLISYGQQSADVNQGTREEDSERRHIQGSRLGHAVVSSYQGHLVLVALRYPDLFRTLCELFPRHFVSMAAKRNDDLHLQLNAVALDSPWMFAFKKIMARKFRMSVEATLMAFLESGIFRRLDTLYQDSLCIYDILKENSGSLRDTYMVRRSILDEERRLHNNLKKSHRITDLEEALMFLKEQEVVRVEAEKIFLIELWMAEGGIARNLSQLLSEPRQPKYWDIDLSSEDFDAVRKDRDQCRAVHLMCHSPVFLLSGKGGCGKTTVVTQLLKHVVTASSPEKAAHFRRWEAFYEEQVKSGQISKSSSSSSSRKEGLEEMATDLAAALALFENSESGEDGASPSLGCGDARQTDADSATFQGMPPEHYLSELPAGKTILLTAATGKAAQVLGRKAKMCSYTLHSVIMSHLSYVNHLYATPDQPKDLGEGEKNEDSSEVKGWNFSDTEILVVDEVSLVSIAVFHHLLSGLMEHSNLCKVILLGDKRQLPSIQPGRFMEDSFEALKTRGLAVDLQTNHRAESKLIVDNATLISRKKMPSFDASRGFHLVPIDKNEENDRDEKIRRLLRTEACLKNPVTSQFVAFRRKDCLAVNELCALYYNNHSLKMASSRHCLDFRVGDKVCMTRNGEVVDHATQNGLPDNPMTAQNLRAEERRREFGDPLGHSVGEASGATRVPRRQTKKGNSQNVIEALKKKGVTKLFNGEVFFITDVREVRGGGKRPQQFLQLSDRDEAWPRELLVWSKELRGTCKMTHAWARTIHTYQGSEAETIVYLVGGSWRQNWQHVYTAVTRGRRAVYVVGNKDTLMECLRKAPRIRKTTLLSRLSECLASQAKELEELMARVSATLQTGELVMSSQEETTPSTWNGTPSLSQTQEKSSSPQKKVARQLWDFSDSDEEWEAFASQIDVSTPTLGPPLGHHGETFNEETPHSSANQKMPPPVSNLGVRQDASWVCLTPDRNHSSVAPSMGAFPSSVSSTLLVPCNSQTTDIGGDLVGDCDASINSVSDPTPNAGAGSVADLPDFPDSDDSWIRNIDETEWLPVLPSKSPLKVTGDGLTSKPSPSTSSSAPMDPSLVACSSNAEAALKGRESPKQALSASPNKRTLEGSRGGGMTPPKQTQLQEVINSPTQPLRRSLKELDFK